MKLAISIELTVEQRRALERLQHIRGDDRLLDPDFAQRWLDDQAQAALARLVIQSKASAARRQRSMGGAP